VVASTDTGLSPTRGEPEFGISIKSEQDLKVIARFDRRKIVFCLIVIASMTIGFAALILWNATVQAWMGAAFWLLAMSYGLVLYGGLLWRVSHGNDAAIWAQASQLFWIFPGFRGPINLAPFSAPIDGISSISTSDVSFSIRIAVEGRWRLIDSTFVDKNYAQISAAIDALRLERQFRRAGT
jgi:hypothetical protein